MNNEMLNADLTSVETSYPIIPAGVYNYTVSEMKIEPTKDKNGDVVLIKLRLAQNAKDVKGRDVYPGLIITDRISLAPTEKYTSDMIRQRLKSFQRACFTADSCPTAFAPLEQYIGKSVTVRVKIESDPKGVYDDSNRIARYIEV